MSKTANKTANNAANDTANNTETETHEIVIDIIESAFGMEADALTTPRGNVHIEDRTRIERNAVDMVRRSAVDMVRRTWSNTSLHYLNALVALWYNI